MDNQIGAILVLLIGISGALYTILQWLKIVIELRFYQKTQGLIIKSELLPKSILNRKKLHPAPLSEIDIVYTYTVDGKKYKSKVVSKNETSFFNKTDYLKKYPKDKRIDVFYDPEKPKKSVLELDTNLAVFVYVTFICLLFIWVGYRYSG